MSQLLETTKRDTAITAAYSNLKDIVNAAENGQPYTSDDSEWRTDLLRCLNNLREHVPSSDLIALGEHVD